MADFIVSPAVDSLMQASNAAAMRAVLGADEAGTARPPTAHTHPAADIANATVTGQALITAADAPAARTVLGTDAAGDLRPPAAHNHTTNGITNATSVGRSLITAADAAAARTTIGTDASGTARPPTAHGHASTDLTDATVTGRALVTAADAAAVRGTIGTDAAGTARPPSAHAHPVAQLTGIAAVVQNFLAAADANYARDAIQAEVLGHQHSTAQITDLTAMSAPLLRAETAADGRAILGVDAAGTVRPPTAHTHTAADLSNATATGLALITAADAAAARAAIGAAAAGSGGGGVDISSRVRFLDHFINGLTSCRLPWAAANSGGSFVAVAPGDGTVVGVVRINTGSTASAGQRGGITCTQVCLRPGSLRMLLAYRIATATFQPDAANITTLRSGLYGVGTAGDPLNGIYFRSISGGRWFAVCRNGGVETAVDTGVTLGALGTWQTLAIRLNLASVDFLINGTLVATITTNIPTTSSLMPYSNIQRDAAVATNLSYDIDWTLLEIEHPTGTFPTL
jgi:hypothetical protein